MYPFFPANFIYLAAKESQNTAHFDNISSCEVQKRGFRTFVAEIKSETLQKIDKDTPGNFLYLFAQTPYSYPFSFLSFLASYTHTYNYINYIARFLNFVANNHQHSKDSMITFLISNRSAHTNDVIYADVRFRG